LAGLIAATGKFSLIEEVLAYVRQKRSKKKKSYISNNCGKRIFMILYKPKYQLYEKKNYHHTSGQLQIST